VGSMALKCAMCMDAENSGSGQNLFPAFLALLEFLVVSQNLSLKFLTPYFSFDKNCEFALIVKEGWTQI
jgi:hypothetical protein